MRDDTALAIARLRFQRQGIGSSTNAFIRPMKVLETTTCCLPPRVRRPLRSGCGPGQTRRSMSAPWHNMALPEGPCPYQRGARMQIGNALPNRSCQLKVQRRRTSNNYHVRMLSTPRDTNRQRLLRFSAELLAILSAYHTRFSDEASRHETLLAQLAAGEDVSIRSNMRGHVTTSATILNERRDKVLLIHHRTFRNWLPPGGHYEPPGSLWDSAVRETSEETGVRIVAPHPWTVESGLPVDIDTHPIPARPEKDEGPHLHHDFRFLAVASDDEALVADLSEVTAARWTPVDELRTSPDERVRALHRKLARLGILAG